MRRNQKKCTEIPESNGDHRTESSDLLNSETNDSGDLPLFRSEVLETRSNPCYSADIIHFICGSVFIAHRPETIALADRRYDIG
jgi:hypothetical protein